MLLEQKNKHNRDKRISFDEPTHVYTIDGDSSYTSVTTWIHSFFGKFNADDIINKMKKGKNWNKNNKYFGMKNQEIKKLWEKNGKEASELGTFMHLNIEYYYNSLPYIGDFYNSKEYNLFQDYLKENKYVAYRTEWTVFTTKYKLAGSIDMIYLDPKYNDNEHVILADWKRSKEIKFENKWEKGKKPLDKKDNCNYNHYCLQLNVYRMLLEKYYNKKVTDMFLVILHPNQFKYKKINIPIIEDEVRDMFQMRLEQIRKNNIVDNK